MSFGILFVNQCIHKKHRFALYLMFLIVDFVFCFIVKSSIKTTDCVVFVVFLLLRFFYVYNKFNF